MAESMVVGRASKPWRRGNFTIWNVLFNGVIMGGWIVMSGFSSRGVGICVGEKKRDETRRWFMVWSGLDGVGCREGSKNDSGVPCVRMSGGGERIGWSNGTVSDGVRLKSEDPIQAFVVGEDGSS